MALKILCNGVVGAGGGTTTLSQLVSVDMTGNNPAYLVVDLLDRNEYTQAATGATGTLAGNGQMLGLTSVDGDGREAGLVFTWNAVTGQYANSIYGDLSQLAYTMSASAHDVTDLALFGTGSLSQAQADAADIYTPLEAGSAGYLGSVSFVTDTAAAAPPSQATPLGIAAAAGRFVGQAWNSEGCWVLASTIAAEAGASLPVQSTTVGVPSVGNGEWVVVYDGPASSSQNWQNLVTTGDVVSFVTHAGSGHVTTCVSGSGSTAQLVDNITYVDFAGDVLNSAHDGSPDDILVASPHAASQEFNGAAANSAVIYALDTPAVTDRVTTANAVTGSSTSLATWFAATDPGQKAITRYQAYEASGTGGLLLAGQAVTAGSAATAVSAASLSSLALLAGSNAGTDTLELRAQNSAGYWGDWQALTVHVAPPAPKPPTVVLQEPNQIWQQGQAVSFVLPTLFSDPQGQALRYTASGLVGTALPAWLHFDPGSRTFSGIVPTTPGALTVVVTGTDTAGLSASERISITIATAAPMVVNPTAAQDWTEGAAVSLQLGSAVFADPQGQALSWSASQPNGSALPSWLHFNAATHSFSGTAPMVAETLPIRITATDVSHLSVYEIFMASIGPAAAGLASAGDWTVQDLTDAPTIFSPHETESACHQSALQDGAMSTALLAPGHNHHHA